MRIIPPPILLSFIGVWFMVFWGLKMFLTLLKRGEL